MLKNWYETLGAGDCLRDHITWNSMIDYVKHSACTDFTIYSQCTVTGQAFRFTKSGAESVMYGGTTTDDDLTIYANDEDAAPYIKLFGNSSIAVHHKDSACFNLYENETAYLRSYSDGGESQLEALGNAVIRLMATQRIRMWDTTDGGILDFYDGAGSAVIEPYQTNDHLHLHLKGSGLIKMFNADTKTIAQFNNDGATGAKWYGGAITGDDLSIYANSTDTYPYIKLEGDGDISIYSKDKTTFYDNGVEVASVRLLSGDMVEITGYGGTNGDLKLRGNRSNTYPYFTLHDGAYASLNVHDSDSGYFKIFRGGVEMFKFGFTGTTQSNLYGAATAGSDFTIYANSSNLDPSIKLNGAGNIEFNCAAGDLDFNCIEAVDFRLENRTDDPASPCVGQIWFRTDL